MIFTVFPRSYKNTKNIEYFGTPYTLILITELHIPSVCVLFKTKIDDNLTQTPDQIFFNVNFIKDRKAIFCLI